MVFMLASSAERAEEIGGSRTSGKVIAGAQCQDGMLGNSKKNATGGDDIKHNNRQ